jgi:hypothetical protein
MQWIRQLISYGLTLAAIIALVTVVPRCSRLRVEPEYNDIDKLNIDESITADSGASLASLAIGDAIAFRLGDQAGGTGQLCLGWIAALPGDEVAISDQAVFVNGSKTTHGDLLTLPDRAPTMIPAGHCFVVSDHHQFDSLAYGPLPAAAICGKLRSLP